MSEWTVNLELDQDGTMKFWRAHLDGSTLVVKHGDAGTAGQTQVRDFGSRVFAKHEFDRLVRTQRKKGYRDAATDNGGLAAPTAAAPAPAPAPAVTPRVPTARGDGVRLVLGVGGRHVTTTIYLDGDVVTMESTETHDSPQTAQRARDRLRKALVGEGYEER